MKKIKLTTSSLKLKKEEIANLSNEEMKHVYGGETGACTTSPCGQQPSQPPACNLTDYTKTCPAGSPASPEKPQCPTYSQVGMSCY